MGSFFFPSRPSAFVKIELPMVLPPDCDYEVRLSPRAEEDGVVRIIRDGSEIMAIYPDGRIETVDGILSLTDALEES